MNEQFIDKIAQKLGVAADRLQPLGEKIIREYVLASWIGAISCTCTTIALLFLLRWCWVAGHRAEFNSKDGFALMGIITGIAALVFAGIAIAYYTEIAAPTYFVLHSFLKAVQ
jgi:hypothetical protein